MESAEVDAMEAAMHAPLSLSNEEHELLAIMLEREQAKLLVEIRHTDNRHFREELRRRLDLLSHLHERMKKI
jgi:hypothetical protein